MFREMDRDDLYLMARQLVPCVGFNTRRAARLMTQFYDHALAPSGLRSTQYSLLTLLSMTEAATIADLAFLMAMDRTSLTRNLGVLRRDGLIVDLIAADRRQRPVGLTDRGRDAFAVATPLWEKAQQAVLAGFGNSDWDDLLARLHRLSRVVEPPPDRVQPPTTRQ